MLWESIIGIVVFSVLVLFAAPEWWSIEPGGAQGEGAQAGRGDKQAEANKQTEANKRADGEQAGRGAAQVGRVSGRGHPDAATAPVPRPSAGQGSSRARPAARPSGPHPGAE